MGVQILFLLFVIMAAVFNRWLFEMKRKRRRDYYRNEYLKSEAWRRKRYVVLKRDNWRCVYCGEHASQVHHKRYARNIGREPIDWLVSICKSCHDNQHHFKIKKAETTNTQQPLLVKSLLLKSRAKEFLKRQVKRRGNFDRR